MTSQHFGTGARLGVLTALVALVVSLMPAQAAQADHDPLYPSGCRGRVQVWGSDIQWRDTCWAGYGYQTNGTLIRGIQSWIWGLGYSTGPVDGYWGSQTQSAVEAFQGNENLSVDGIVGTNTWDRMWDHRLTLNCGGGSCQYRTWRHPRYHSQWNSVNEGQMWVDICANKGDTEYRDDPWDHYDESSYFAC